jgi:hypothetical protein
VLQAAAEVEKVEQQGKEDMKKKIAPCGTIFLIECPQYAFSLCMHLLVLLIV